MIRSFKHDGLKRLHYEGSKAGVNPQHVTRLRNILGVLDRAKQPEDMDIDTYSFHGLIGDRQGFWSVKVRGGWCVIFTFDGPDAVLVDYLNYHS